jgi:two-component system LytT family response regulator/two-component system response regulator LytT
MSDRAIGIITAVIADDEQLACDELAYLLREYPEIELLDTAYNGLETVRLIQELRPDLVFLDVQMPGLDGLGVIRKLQERNVPLPYFILATAYEQYAVEAFRLEALDYLLKPVDRDRLSLTIERARRIIQAKAKLQPLEPPPIERPATPRTKLLVKSQNRDVIYASIQDGLITLVATSLEGQSNYRTIEELQSSLDPETFWRVHRSYLVNINRIKEVIPWFKSSYMLRMDDKKQTEVPVSRVQTKRLRTLLKL